MKNNKKILILNTGGTFNKIYNEICGTLDVLSTNDTIKYILTQSKISNVKVDGVLYKDSLDIKNKHRKQIVRYLQSSKYKKVIIVHGTDTMNITAAYLDKYIDNKTIILTGAMKPFSIDPIEATANLMSAYGFLVNCTKQNIYISMHGIIKPYKKVTKNRALGLFECH